VGLGNVSRQKAKPAPRTEREEGRYANCEIGHSAFGIWLEFGQRDVGIYTRVSLSLECARMLSDTLLEVIRVYSVSA
jgi:hypothetical protein